MSAANLATALHSGTSTPGLREVPVAPPVPGLPRPSPGWWRLFGWYNRRYLARHFHAVRLLGPRPLNPPPEVPLAVFLNHPSWWDPLLGLLAHQHFFGDRRGFAPIEAAMLERYRFFARLGFFGVEAGTTRGAVQFLRAARQRLQTPGAALWVTPQGRFADVRERPVRFKPGLGHLAARLGRAVFLPLAIEITPWQERTPEALLHFGPPIESGRESLSPAAWTARFEAALEAAQDTLATAACRRAQGDFQILLRGAAGVGGWYDRWRRARARWRGEDFHPEHGTD